MRRSLPPDRIADLLEPVRGLTRDEAAARMARFGSNQVIEAPPHPWRELMRETAKDPMPRFLAATGALYAALASAVHLAPLRAADWGMALATASVAGATLLAASMRARARVGRRPGAGVSSPPSKAP